MMSSPPPRSSHSPACGETIVSQSDNGRRSAQNQEETTSQTTASDSQAPAPDPAEQIPCVEQSNGTGTGEEPSTDAPGGRRTTSQPASRAASITEPTSPNLLANSPLPAAGSIIEIEPNEAQILPDTSHSAEAARGEAPATPGRLAWEVKTQAEEQGERVPKLFWLMIGGTGQPPRRGRFWRQAARRKAKGVVSNDEGQEEKNSGASSE